MKVNEPQRVITSLGLMPRMSSSLFTHLSVADRCVSIFPGPTLPIAVHIIGRVLEVEIVLDTDYVAADACIAINAPLNLVHT